MREPQKWAIGGGDENFQSVITGLAQISCSVQTAGANIYWPAHPLSHRQLGTRLQKDSAPPCLPALLLLLLIILLPQFFPLLRTWHPQVEATISLHSGQQAQVTTCKS